MFFLKSKKNIEKSEKNICILILDLLKKLIIIALQNIKSLNYFNMYTSETKIRVRYGETDKMGYVYYGIYPLYYEVGRTELMRNFDFPYKKIEDMGIMLPVIDLSIKYHKAAIYDDLLLVKTIIKKLPGVRITFNYEIYNEQNELLNEGETTLVFIDSETRKPRKAPEDLLNKLKNYF